MKRPDWVLDPRPVALTSSTLPRLVSRKDPTGIWRASVSGTKVSPFWLAPARRALAGSPGVAIRTGPSPTGPTFTTRPIVGSGRSSSSTGGGGGGGGPSTRRTRWLSASAIRRWPAVVSVTQNGELSCPAAAGPPSPPNPGVPVPDRVVIVPPGDT